MPAAGALPAPAVAGVDCVEGTSEGRASQPGPGVLLARRFTADTHVSHTLGPAWSGKVPEMSGPDSPVREFGVVRPRTVVTRPDGNPIHVLVVDDEPALTDLVSMALQYEGWKVSSAADGASAIRAVRELSPDLVVLDVMLPDMSGLEVLQRIHQFRPALSVLLLTAKDSIEDRIAGLSAGGDDYVTKPFSVEEVVLRLRALVRRTGIAVADDTAKVVVGDLVMNEDSHEVTRAGAEIALTATEFDVLQYLMHNPGRVLSKAQILERVWDYDFDGRSNVVELYISYLRRKIDVGRAPMIHTVRRVGYVLKAC